VLEDHANRQALWERLQFSLDGEPDPWFEHDKAHVDARQFESLGLPGTRASGTTRREVAGAVHE
jgi:nitrite reductase (NADH) large subunit